MAEAKRILVVDDHFEMLEFLRSMLELSNQDYEVLAVPSAEEGLLELKRTHFDLLITDVRLPGMSGFDLVRQVRRLNRPLPVIMITAYSSTQGQREAADLGVLRYFRKPLDTDAVVTAVHVALYGDDAPIPQTGVLVEAAASSGPSSDAVRLRLDSLRADTGAAGLLLVSSAGDVVVNVGNLRGLSSEAVATAVTANLVHSFELADLLHSAPPLTIQYHAGMETELYFVNVGRHYAVVMLFDAQARRGRIGTIWVFAQRAIKDLVEMLPAPKTAVEPAESASTPATAVTPTPAVVPEPQPEPESIPVSAEEVAALASLFEEVPPSEDTDLESFWHDALTVEDQDVGKGLSWEEAQAKGLIPSEFDEIEPEE